MAGDAEAQTVRFACASEWEQWLFKHHRTHHGVWVQIAKKASGVATVTYDEALDAALCYGWIDGQRKGHSEDFFVQRFTPRRPHSLWSKRNAAKVLHLIASAKMQPAGLAQVEAAQTDGRWEAAYDGQKDLTIPDDFLWAVRQDETTEAFFLKLSRANLYAIARRLQTAAKPEIRARRFAALLKTLEQGEEIR